MTKNITFYQVWKYILDIIRPFRLSISVMLWVAFFWALDLSVRPYLLKVILNRLSDGGTAPVFDRLLGPIGLYLFLYLIMTSSFRLYGYFVEVRMIPEMREKIANEALGKLIDKNHHYYQNNFSGSLTNKVNDLTSSVPDLVQSFIDRFVSHSLALAIAVITLWQVNGLFALFMLTWTITFILASLILSKKLNRLADDWAEYGSIITGKMVDVLSNILSVRLFTAKDEEKKALKVTFQGAVKAERKLQWTYFWMWLFYGYSFFILLSLNFYFLCKGYQEGWVSVGDFALVLVINISIIDFLWQIMKEFSQFSKLYGRITQALAVLFDESELIDGPHCLVVTRGQIDFARVKFHYKDAQALFHNKTITIEAGTKVGLVGYSGGGKTTFVNLILRLYDINEGQILIDGQDIRCVTQDSLRHHIAMIPQDPSLFHRTLLENIRYGRPMATDREVIEAAQKAHAHDFITSLPLGYETLVGERGVKLSGGQRQRIAIARAILKNAPILILDEATSQLDSVTESDIQESLWQLMQNKTTIVIAHRLSTLLHMDRLLVFDKGKIIEDGTHTALLQKGGLYKTLWDAQVGGFLPETKNFLNK